MGGRGDDLVARLQSHFAWPRVGLRFVNVILPGTGLDPHVDDMGPDWLMRIHVPLLTNPQSVFIVGGLNHRLDVGAAYRVNTLLEHSVRNDGATPRVHYIFDVHA